MLKYVGIFLLSSSLSAYGNTLSSSLKSSMQLRREIILLLKEIARTIEFSNRPIIDVIKDSQLPLLSKTGFCDSYGSAESAQSVILSTLSALCQKDREMLSAFLSSVGKSAYGDLELKNCRYYIDFFEGTQAEYEREVLSKSLLYKKIGIIIGILSAIIFI